jgi:hypothetical protein
MHGTIDLRLFQMDGSIGLSESIGTALEDMFETSSKEM